MIIFGMQDNGAASVALIAADRLDLVPDLCRLGNVQAENRFERVGKMIRARDALFADALCRHAAQAIVLQGDIAIRGMPQDRQRVRERRAGILRQPAERGGDGGLIAVIGPEIEAVRHAARMVPETQPAVVCRHDRKIEAALADRPDGKRHRLDDGVRQADLGKVRAVEIDAQCQMVADGVVAQCFTIDAAAQAGHAESERGKRRAEQAIHLVAPAAALALHHLGEGGGRDERGWPSHESIQCLPGEGQEMGAVKFRQAGNVERRRPFDPDPCKIGVQLAGRQGHSTFA